MKLYVASDSDGTVCLYTKKPVRRDYIFGFGYDPDGGQYAEIPCLDLGEVYELNFMMKARFTIISGKEMSYDLRK